MHRTIQFEVPRTKRKSELKKASVAPTLHASLLLTVWITKRYSNGCQRGQLMPQCAELKEVPGPQEYVK